MLRFLPVTLTIIIWSWSEVFIKHLQKAGFDVYSQNFFRYAFGALVMLILAFMRDKEGLKKAFLSRKFILAGVLCAAYQTAFVLGLYYVYPAYTALIKRSNMLMTVLIGVIFFADERRLAGNWKFLLALVVALAGVSGVIAFHPSMAVAEDRTGLIIGSTLIIMGSFFWVGYAFMVKLMTRKAPAIPSFAAASSVMAVVLFVVAVIAQSMGKADLGHFFRVGWFDLVVLFGSGVVNIGIAQVLYYLSIDLAGVTLTQTLSLAGPLLVGINSYLVFRERLTAPQWLSGLVLLLALGYVLYLERTLPKPSVVVTGPVPADGDVSLK